MGLVFETWNFNLVGVGSCITVILRRLLSFELGGMLTFYIFLKRVD